VPLSNWSASLKVLFVSSDSLPLDHVHPAHFFPNELQLSDYVYQAVTAIVWTDNRWMASPVSKQPPGYLIRSVVSIKLKVSNYMMGTAREWMSVSFMWVPEILSHEFRKF